MQRAGVVQSFIHSFTSTINSTCNGRLYKTRSCNAMATRRTAVDSYVVATVAARSRHGIEACAMFQPAIHITTGRRQPSSRVRLSKLLTTSGVQLHLQHLNVTTAETDAATHGVLTFSCTSVASMQLSKTSTPMYHENETRTVQVKNFSPQMYKVSERLLSLLNCIFIMAALLYFCPVVSIFYLSIYLFSSPNLSGRRLDVYHTSTHGVALVRI